MGRNDVLKRLVSLWDEWPDHVERLEFADGWSWSVDEHGFMKLGDITYLDFYQAKGVPLPRDLMIKHLEARLDEWPVSVLPVGVVLDRTGWGYAQNTFVSKDPGARPIEHADTRMPISLAEPRKTSYFATRSLADELAELLQCKPDQVLDVVRNLVPDWHTVPAHVDLLQPVWSHAQGYKQHRPVFLKRPKAPVDQETVDDLLARFDKDSLQEAFK